MSPRSFWPPTRVRVVRRNCHLELLLLRLREGMVVERAKGSQAPGSRGLRVPAQSYVFVIGPGALRTRVGAVSREMHVSLRINGNVEPTPPSIPPKGGRRRGLEPRSTSDLRGFGRHLVSAPAPLASGACRCTSGRPGTPPRGAHRPTSPLPRRARPAPSARRAPSPPMGGRELSRLCA